jgi:hypothetical protein
LLKIVKVKTDISPAHLRHFLQDDIYLLKADKDVYANPQANSSTATLNTAAAAPVQPPVVTEQTPVLQFKYLGGNQKNFLVLCCYADAEFIASAHLTALISTITRINYSQDDIAIVNLINYPKTTWPELVSYFGPKKLLVLGSKALPATLPKLNQNEAQHLDECQALYTFSFDEMMGNKENTKAFWNQIKTF